MPRAKGHLTVEPPEDPPRALLMSKRKYLESRGDDCGLSVLVAAEMRQMGPWGLISQVGPCGVTRGGTCVLRSR